MKSVIPLSLLIYPLLSFQYCFTQILIWFCPFLYRKMLVACHFLQNKGLGIQDLWASGQPAFKSQGPHLPHAGFVPGRSENPLPLTPTAKMACVFITLCLWCAASLGDCGSSQSTLAPSSLVWLSECSVSRSFGTLGAFDSMTFIILDQR